MQKITSDLTLFFIATTILLIILMIIIFIIIYYHRKREIIFAQKIKESNEIFENNILDAKVEIQEQTFQYISKEIHDNINLKLTLAKLNLNTTKADNKLLDYEKIASSINILSESISQLNDLSKSLDTNTIAQHGIIPALENEMERIQKSSGLEIKFNVTGNPVFMDSRSETLIFRIVQEAFNNILKHAGATRARLLLAYRNEALRIRIHDNGRGFHLAELNRNGHSGLGNMEARSTLLNGRMEIQSRPGQGARLEFLIPINTI